MTDVKPYRSKDEISKGSYFKMRTQLLSRGRSHTILASCSSGNSAMNIAIKCYAGGGENEFHTHATEDHTFIVLQGSALFSCQTKSHARSAVMMAFFCPLALTIGLKQYLRSRWCF